MKKELKRDGGPWDCGRVDNYYNRGAKPHMYEKHPAVSKRIEEDRMSDEEIEEYFEGYEAAEAQRQFKEATGI